MYKSTPVINHTTGKVTQVAGYYHIMYSHPNDGDADKDGYSDCGDPNPEYKENYSFLDNEIYYVYGCIPYQTASYLCVKENKIGSTVFGDGLTESDNGRFRFKWCDKGYAIYNGELALTVNSDKSITLEEYTGSESQLWEITKFDIGKYSEGELGYGYGVKVRSKILDGSNSMYLSAFDGEVYVTSNQEECGCFNVVSLSSEWVRFGQIYMQYMNWCDYGIGREKSQKAIKNYIENISLGVKEENDFDIDISIDNINDGDESATKFSNIYIVDNYKLLYAQYAGNFPNMKFADTKMSKVCCGIIATYNALVLVGEYDVWTKGTKTNELDKFFRLAVEFEINNLYLLSSGTWGTSPNGIENCLISYNLNYMKHENVEEMDNNVLHSKSIIVCYEFDVLNLRMHLYSCYYDHNTKKIYSINRGGGNLYVWENNSIKECIGEKHFKIGYILS